MNSVFVNAKRSVRIRALYVFVLFFCARCENSLASRSVDRSDSTVVNSGWEVDPFRWESWLAPSYLSAFDIDDEVVPDPKQERSQSPDDVTSHNQTHSTLPEFDFPVFVLNNPSRPDRRRHMELLLPQLGFTNVSFPQGLSASELDIPSLIAAGLVHPDAAARIANHPYKGPGAVAPYIANAVAHLLAIRACAAAARPLCAVLEDDVFAPEGPAAARARIAAALGELPAGADMLYLEACFEKCAAVAYSPRRRHLARAAEPFCAAAVRRLAVTPLVSPPPPPLSPPRQPFPRRFQGRSRRMQAGFNVLNRVRPGRSLISDGQWRWSRPGRALGPLSSLRSLEVESSLSPSSRF
jgi:hypothetical protein